MTPVIRQRVRGSRALPWLLLLSLLVAAAHVSQHAIADGERSDCHVCRIDHTPGLHSPAAVAPPALWAMVHVVAEPATTTFSVRSDRWLHARAPPLLRV